MRTKILNISLVLMPPALLLSRFALSLLIIIYVCAAVSSRAGIKRLAALRTQYWHLVLLLLFFLPFLSGIWSEDKIEWLRSLQVKIPLLVLPIGFLARGPLDKKTLHEIAWSFILCSFVAAAWTVPGYFSANAEVERNYLRSMLLHTPLSNDHVRFSWMLSIAAITGVVMYAELRSKIMKTVLLISSGFLLVYLHLLAARTGLLALYMTAIGWLFLKAVYTRRFVPALLAVAIIFLPFFAYWLLPTFQNRVRYVFYDFGFFSKAHYAPGMNDALRVISWRAGLGIWQNSPWTGVGAGDIGASLISWYQLHYPAMPPAEYLLPGNELINYLATVGLFGGFIMLAVLLLPYLLKKQGPGKLIGYSLPALLLFDAALEVQYGVFLFCFVTLIAQSWLKSSEQDCT